MRLAVVVLALVGAGLVGVGVQGLVVPAALLAPVELAVATPSGLSEARANYGGMHLGLGLLLLAGIVRAGWRRPALVVTAVFLGGLVAGRLVSLAVDGAPSAFVLGLLALEAGGTALALAALRGAAA